MKEYRVRYWLEDGSEEYTEFDSREQAQEFYDGLNGMAEIQRYMEEIHDYMAVEFPTFEY